MLTQYEPHPGEHDWHIWPETDGMEQRCSECGIFRKTPYEAMFWLAHKGPAVPADDLHRRRLEMSNLLNEVVRHAGEAARLSMCFDTPHSEYTAALDRLYDARANILDNIK